MFSIVATDRRTLARDLRRERGLSLKAIAIEVGASISSGSRWVRDVELTEHQLATLEANVFNGHVKGRAVNTALRRRVRALSQEEGSQSDPFHEFRSGDGTVFREVPPQVLQSR
jgi:transcriptional regulator with XRE-family HTH domain